VNCYIVVVLQGCRKFNYLFFCFWFCLLFCRLLWSGLGKLVLMMERDPLLFNWKILWGVWITVLRKDWCRTFKRMEGGGQEATIWSWLRKRNGGQSFFLLGVGGAKFRFCSLRSVAFVWIWIVLSWGQKYL
jgi:hypothetical protein